MSFKNSGDKNTIMSISEARPDVTQQKRSNMDAILAADIFRPNGFTLLTKADCKLVGNHRV